MRYTLYLTATLTGGASNETTTWYLNTAELIPEKYFNKRVRVSSNAYLSSQSTGSHGNFVVSCNFPQASIHNRLSTSTTYTPIGLAVPFAISGGYVYSYFEPTCLAKDIVYTHMDKIVVNVKSLQNTNITASTSFILNLVFDFPDE